MRVRSVKINLNKKGLAFLMLKFIYLVFLLIQVMTWVIELFSVLSCNPFSSNETQLCSKIFLLLEMDYMDVILFLCPGGFFLVYLIRRLTKNIISKWEHMLIMLLFSMISIFFVVLILEGYSG